VISAAFAAAMAAACYAPAHAADTLKIGVVATLEGPLSTLGEDAVRGVKTALKAVNNMAGGRQIEVIYVASDATPDSAVRAVRKLVEEDKVDLVIGPVSGDEGIAIKDYAKTQPNITFLNGQSGAQDTTYRNPAPNFFRFTADGAQQMAGLGSYIYDVKGYKKIATVGDDYSYPYTQEFGLVVEYCSAGGEVTQRFWPPLGTKDYSSIITALPDDVDAIFVALGGADAVNFVTQYVEAGGKAKIVGGAIMVDQTVLSAKGEAKNALIGTVSAGVQADTWDDPKWQAYVKAYQDAFPPDQRFPIPSASATTYYDSIMAAFTVLNQINGDLSDGQKKFRDGLKALTLDAPNGKLHLDDNRQGIVTNFVTEVVEGPDGNLATKVVKVVENVNQQLGIDPAVFATIGAPSRDVPECKKYK
jgi:ABC-type branched-subunit amino acid transport system substrate-binding protein